MGAEASIWRMRVRDYARHVADLRQRGYEGALSRGEKEKILSVAFNWMTPVAVRALEDVSKWYLSGTGSVSINQPRRDSAGGLVGTWELTWPLLEADRDRITGEPMPPVALTVVFPLEWTHPHLALLAGADRSEVAYAWPLQVTAAEDAARQDPILRAMAEAEVHDRIYCAKTNWAVLPADFSDAEC